MQKTKKEQNKEKSMACDGQEGLLIYQLIYLSTLYLWAILESAFSWMSPLSGLDATEFLGLGSTDCQEYRILSSMD